MHADGNSGSESVTTPTSEDKAASKPQAPSAEGRKGGFLAATVEELKGRDVEFLDDITDMGYGLAIHLEMPGGVKTQLYQPHYEKRAR